MDIALDFDLAAPADDVAAVLLRFDGLAGWYIGIEDFRVEGDGVGAVRSYRLGEASIQERLDAIDPGERRFAYSTLAGPLPVTDYRASCEVLERDGGSRVAWRASFSVAVPQLAEPMATAAKLLQETSLELLKIHVEDGVDLATLGL